MSEDKIVQALEAQRKIADAALRDIKQKIADATERAEEERKAPLKDLAILAHDTLCSWNHTDGCGWGYEVTKGLHNWSGHAHDRWLSQVDRLVNGGNDRNGRGRRTMDPLSAEALGDILRALAEIKSKHRDALWMLRYGLSA